MYVALCLEVGQQLIKRLFMISLELFQKGRELVNHAVKLVNGYMSYLKRAGANTTVKEKRPSYGSDNGSIPDNQ